MKLSLAALYKNPKPSLKALLLSSFEEDLLESGLQNLLERCYNIQKKKEVLRLPASLLKSDPTKPLEILASSPLFGPSPLLILDKMTDSYVSALETFLTRIPESIFFIVTTGYLRSTSPLRSFFESGKSLAHVPLYAPTLADIAYNIKEIIKEYDHTIEDALLIHLSHLYLETPYLVRSELVPFCLFFEKPSFLKNEDYLAFTKQTLSSEVQSLEFFLRKDKAFLTRPSSFSFIPFLRLLNFHMTRLLEMRPTLALSSSSLKWPRLSLKDKDLYEKALQVWTTSDILEVLSVLHDFEIKVKEKGEQTSEELIGELFKKF